MDMSSSIKIHNDWGGGGGGGGGDCLGFYIS